MSQNEQALIGAAVMGSAFVDAQPLVDVDDFALQSHRLIWQRCVDLAAEGVPIDFMTVSDGLARETQAYLTGVCAQSFSTENVKAYASAVTRDALARRIDDLAVKIAAIEGEPEKRLADIQSLVLSVNTKADSDEGVSAREAMRQLFAELEERYEAEGDFGLKTGLPAVDEKLGGMAPSDLIVIAGRPSHGKTAFMMEILRRNPDVASLVFSHEMSRTQLMSRLVSSVGRVDGGRLRQAKTLQEEDWPRITSAMNDIVKRDLMVCDRGGMHINQVCAMARRHKLRNPRLGLIAIDYLQLIHSDGFNQNERVSKVSGALKALAKELDLPVVVLSQLNRDVDKRPAGHRRPVMSDLRDSGSIEQDADAILFIYRDEVYDENSRSKGTAEIIAGKVRHGVTGSARVSFLGQHMRFEPYTGRPIEDTPIKGRRNSGMDY